MSGENDFVSRMNEELKSLNDKLEKINKFISSEIFLGLSDDRKYFLRKQHIHMRDYAEVLKARIDLESN